MTNGLIVGQKSTKQEIAKQLKYNSLYVRTIHLWEFSWPKIHSVIEKEEATFFFFLKWAAQSRDDGIKLFSIQHLYIIYIM